jgi:hypothetical protein
MSRGIPSMFKPKASGETVSPRDLSHVVDEVAKVAQEISADRRPQLSSELAQGEQQSSGLKGIELLAASTVLVPHGLGREYEGWKVTRKFHNAVVWEDGTSTADKTRFVPLACSANCTVQLEVF